MWMYCQRCGNHKRPIADNEVHIVASVANSSALTNALPIAHEPMDGGVGESPFPNMAPIQTLASSSSSSSSTAYHQGENDGDGDEDEDGQNDILGFVPIHGIVRQMPSMQIAKSSSTNVPGTSKCRVAVRGLIQNSMSMTQIAPLDNIQTTCNTKPRVPYDNKDQNRATLKYVAPTNSDHLIIREYDRLVEDVPDTSDEIDIWNGGNVKKNSFPRDRQVFFFVFFFIVSVSRELDKSASW